MQDETARPHLAYPAHQCQFSQDFELELDIRVQPRASRNAIEVDGDRSDVKSGLKIMVRVTAAPEDGKANDAVVALLAKRLRVPKRSIQIARGHKSRDKRIYIAGVSAEKALECLQAERA